MNSKYISKCSRCGKPLKNVTVEVKLDTHVFRLKSSGVWEKIPNFNLNSREIICEDCFNLLINSLETWRKKK